MLLSSTWRVGVGKGFTPPHLHGHTVVKVLSFLLILPDTLSRASVSSKRVARIHVAQSRHIILFELREFQRLECPKNMV
jgi:hypothetical protein